MKSFNTLVIKKIRKLEIFSYRVLFFHIKTPNVSFGCRWFYIKLTFNCFQNAPFSFVWSLFRISVLLLYIVPPVATIMRLFYLLCYSWTKSKIDLTPWQQLSEMFRYIKIFQHLQLRKLKIKLVFHKKKGLKWNSIKMICLGMSRHLRVVVVRYAPKKHKLLELFIDNLCTFDIFLFD